MDKYLRVNFVKRKFIASATRHKISNLLFSLTFQVRLIDAVYVSAPVIERKNSSVSGAHNMRFERQLEEQKNMEALVRQRIERLDQELERLKRKGEEADRIRMH